MAPLTERPTLVGLHSGRLHEPLPGPDGRGARLVADGEHSAIGLCTGARVPFVSSASGPMRVSWVGDSLGISLTYGSLACYIG